jgi:hypothetical protein
MTSKAEDLRSVRRFRADDDDDDDASADCGCPSAKYILAAAILFWTLHILVKMLYGT